jgi:hypothetical protein
MAKGECLWQILFQRSCGGGLQPEGPQQWHLNLGDRLTLKPWRLNRTSRRS